MPSVCVCVREKDNAKDRSVRTGPGPQTSSQSQYVLIQLSSALGQGDQKECVLDRVILFKLFGKIVLQDRLGAISKVSFGMVSVLEWFGDETVNARCVSWCAMVKSVLYCSFKSVFNILQPYSIKVFLHYTVNKCLSKITLQILIKKMAFN